ncbi:MAG: polynucleotide adenylyltransferase PcnB [Victivallaceae bacterium]
MQPTIYRADHHNLDLSVIDPNALFVIKILKRAGYRAYLVGGCIRDMLLNEHPKDFDISTSAKPEEIKACFKSCILVGRRFRLAHVRFGNSFIEVSTFRSGDPTEEELIIKDNLWGTPEEDVLRRDFTINGLFYDPQENVIIDYTGGVRDLKKQFLRTIGNPFLRFKQDPVRMIRLLKILSRYDFVVDETTKEALFACKDELLKSSKARVFEEIIKVLISSSSNKFFKLLKTSEFLSLLFSKLDCAFKTESFVEKTTLNFLKALDSFDLQDKNNIDRGFLIATLVCPIIDFDLRLKKKTNKKITNGFILETIREQLTEFFVNSFTGCSKKNFITALLILQTQYKMTPLNPKHNKMNPKLVRHPYFRSALKLLYIRKTVNPKLEKKYIAWSEMYDENQSKESELI